jgi:SAM-dependent methyltransferase
VTKTVANNFFDEWSIYDQVLDHNYMYHDEIYGDVRRILADRYETRPFMLLDLGCGSARHLARALQGRPVSRYVGYDLSDVALAHARRNLTGLGCRSTCAAVICSRASGQAAKNSTSSLRASPCIIWPPEKNPHSFNPLTRG